MRKTTVMRENVFWKGRLKKQLTLTQIRANELNQFSYLYRVKFGKYIIGSYKDSGTANVEFNRIKASFEN
jgi:hypothetical protein